ncbi:uncharacterized protein BO80DRAFT_468417 [Aspergillus ibericus CBS 121593]|uniref:Mid2 domain-containing protein n=1 Tax=Aspergillus ibericus CBS 121593 TaxID=1448316 RepID=A0A395GM84_9EURO|nr:hypothetical protein BO80DRAFT_468417 [Aspergillus ibericus CBS 121593]RAK96621.1 hypothetical protein BO80DRAFT_468417 [Aspergillus ibericus CBS 121593]
MHPQTLPITLTLLLSALISSTTSWTLTTRNSTTGATIIHETAPQPCTPIHHQQGYEFSFDPEGSWCLDFWSEATCQTRIGWSCDGQVWRKVASKDIDAFDVYVMPNESTSTSTSTSTGVSGSTGVVVDASASASATGSGDRNATATATGTGTAATQQADENGAVNSESQSGSKISGGAIAGVVVGVVAGVAVLGMLGFLLWRRRGQKRVDAGDGAGQGTHGSPESGPRGELDAEGVVAGQKPVVSEVQKGHAELYHDAHSGMKRAELSGQGASAELGGHQVAELDGQGYERKAG